MNKTILISGVSRGIGKQLLIEFLNKGHYVVGLVRNEESKSSLNIELIEIGFDSFEIIVCDVTDDEGLYFLGQNLPNIISEVDVLVNNAAIGVGEGLLKDVDFNSVKSFFDVNFFGAWRLYQTVDSFLKTGSRIINVSSNLGLSKGLLDGGLPAYRMSKWALNGFTIQLSAELRSRGVDVISVCPGWTQTDMGGKDALNSIEESVSNLKDLCSRPVIKTGAFYENGKVVEW